MNEFDLQMWERELGAWQRRLERQPPGALRSVLHEIADHVHHLRVHPAPLEAERWVRAELMRRFAALRTLYEEDAHTTAVAS